MRFNSHTDEVLQWICEYDGEDVINAVFDVLVGSNVGRGVSRVVFASRLNKDYVFKFAHSGSQDNALEYRFWCDADEKLRKWLAPCVRLSNNCMLLVQEKVAPVTIETLRKTYPKVPSCFTDLKVGNWGLLPNGRIVCCDYALVRDCDSRRMRKAEWWQ